MRVPENSDTKNPVSPLELKGQGETMTTLVKTGVLKRPHMCLRRGTESEGEQRKNTLDLLKVCSQEKESGK